jgi:hypothetical protein
MVTLVNMKDFNEWEEDLADQTLSKNDACS